MSLPSAPPPPLPAAPEPRLVPPSSTAHLVVRLALLVAVLASVAYALLRPTGADRSGLGSYDAPDALIALAVLVALTATIIAGPEPRLATRWAWFWLVAYVWPAAVVYLLLEPTAAWRREPARAPGRRLTGGWGFLIGLLLGTPLTALLARR
jgi:hypothetical protein